MKQTVIALLLMLAALPLAAAEKDTVQQMEAVITSAQAAGDTDGQIARKIDRMTLTERLTDATLAALLKKTPGTETARELQIQADRSAFGEPPASELPEAARPAISELRLMIARAVNYTSGFIHNLPDFICTEAIRRLDDDPTRPLEKAAKWKHIRVRDTLVQQLTFEHGRESTTVQMVNGRAYNGRQEMLGMVTRGEFGNMLSVMLLGKSGLKAWWSHWETLDGKRLAVFHYAVDRAHSTYAISYCCHVIQGPGGRAMPNTIITAFQGELFLEPASGTIFRVTWQTVGIPAAFPTRQTSTLVEYRPVDIGGRSYMCPVKSISISDSVIYAAEGPFTYPIHSINEVRFTHYRKFETEATFLEDRASRGRKAGLPQLKNSSVQVMTPEVTVQPEAPFVPPELPPTLTAIPEEKSGPEESASLHPLTAFPLPAPPPFLSAPETAQNGSTGISGKPATFVERLNVVTVPVVVRDSRGRAVGHLSKSDFELFDGRKREPISGFSVEQAESAKQADVGKPSRSGESVGDQGAVLPDRYVAYLFDDLHLAAGDLQQARKAAERVLKGAEDEGSRVAVFSTSGVVATSFANDRTELERAWNRIMPVSRAAGCPAISYYMAERIVNFNDASALSVAVAKAEACGAAMPPQGMSTAPPLPNPQAEAIVKAAARQSLNEHDQESRVALLTLQRIVRRMAVLPGQRTVVLISPGFATSFLSSDIDAVIDQAARSGVVVNAVDARGLYGPAGFDVETRGLGDANVDTRKREYDSDAQKLQSNILAELADGTGGSFFENSNDLQGGIERAAARPDVSYVLAFTPQEQRADGSFHRLKVSVVGRRGLTVEARRGYFAPKHLADSAEQVKQALIQAVFSREKVNDLPVTLQTQLAETGSGGSKLTLIAHVDIHSIPFEKENGRNRDTLTAVVSLFDSNGGYVKGLQDRFELDFPDETLPARMASGVKFKNDFDVKAGTYLVRLVLRDEQGQMATADRSVAVP